MKGLGSEFKDVLRARIINNLYGADKDNAEDRKNTFLRSTVSDPCYARGQYLIYYAGYEYLIDTHVFGTDTTQTRIDLLPKYHKEMDAILLAIHELNDEIHNVEGLIRSVLNASNSIADIRILMPDIVVKRCDALRFLPHDHLYLTNEEIAFFEQKHEKMLKGIKQKVLRDLLFRSR